MPKVRRFLSGLRWVLECASYLAVISGVFFFFWTQAAARKAQQVEMAMRFVTLSSEPAYAEARERLIAPFRGYDMRVIAPGAAPRIAGEAPIEMVERMKDFYSSVLSCRGVLCDRDVIDQFFREDINSFYCFYRDQIAEIGAVSNRPDYREDLRRYTGDCVALQRQR